MADWTIERPATHHDRTEFDCGKDPLSAWIKRSAGQFDKRGLARTYVAVRPAQTRVLGYYAIATAHTRHDDVPPASVKGLPHGLAIPCALIGKLATDRTVGGHGLGSMLLIDALRRIQDLADTIGIRLATVDAIDDDARDFYLHQGFHALLDDPRHLFLTIPVIRQLGFPAPSR